VNLARQRSRMVNSSVCSAIEHYLLVSVIQLFFYNGDALVMQSHFHDINAVQVGYLMLTKRNFLLNLCCFAGQLRENVKYCTNAIIENYQLSPMQESSIFFFEIRVPFWISSVTNIRTLIFLHCTLDCKETKFKCDFRQIILYFFPDIPVFRPIYLGISEHISNTVIKVILYLELY
jgi:hypothetical protein